MTPNTISIKIDSRLILNFIRVDANTRQTLQAPRRLL